MLKKEQKNVSFVENYSNQQTMKNSLEEVKNRTAYPHLKKIAEKKLEIIINKNSGEELEMELDKLIELVEESERERIRKELKQDILIPLNHLLKPLTNKV